MSQFSEEQLKKFEDLKLVGGSVNTSYKPTKFDYSGINEMLKNSIPFVPPFIQQQPIAKTGENFSKRQEIERQQILALEQAKFNSEKAMSDAQKNKKKEPIYYILVTAGVMIAGYIAYKKFKK